MFADFTHTNFSNETPTDIPTDIPTEILTRPDLTVFSLGARFSRNVTRDTALSAGYRYNTGEFGYRLGQTTGEHAVDFGFDTTRRVSATRRIDLSASVGGSVVEIPEGAVEFGAVPRQYRLNAEASASYPLSRTARLRGVYTRGLQYVGGLSRPVFVDGFSGELNGRVFGRIDIFGRIGRAAGQPVGTSDDLLDTYTSQLKITYLVTREFSAYAEYIYYEYQDNGEFLPAQIPLVPGLPPDLKREAIHVGLAWQLPLLRR